MKPTKQPAAYVPDRGDMVWVNLGPTAGHEQTGRRPVLVLSPRAYSAKTGLALVCPVTSQVKGYPFEVELPDERELHGVILADHLRSIDWRSRNAEFTANLPADVVTEVLARLAPLVIAR